LLSAGCCTEGVTVVVVKSKQKVVAITGTSEFLGGLLLRALINEDWCERILALDEYPPTHHAKVIYHPIQLEHMESEKELHRFLDMHGCTTFIHAASPQHPMRNLERLHEILSVGSMYLLNLVAKTHVKHLILASTTEVYGATSTNPNMLTETSPRHASRGNPFLHDKIDVEKQFEYFGEHHHDVTISILRMCTILGQTSRTWMTRFLRQRLIPTVAGYDPLVQFVHENDVIRAFLHLIQHPHQGAFNIVGDGVMPLSRAIAMADKTAVPVPSPLFYITADMLWQASVSPVPSASIDYLKYGCVADGGKARRELKFEPVYNSEEALMTFLDAHREEE